jgi:hypothetical protein
MILIILFHFIIAIFIIDISFTPLFSADALFQLELSGFGFLDISPLISRHY